MKKLNGKFLSLLVVSNSMLFSLSIAEAQQAVRLRASEVPVQASLSKGESLVLSDLDQKRADVEFNQRRLLRFHQLWNLYLFRNEEEERDLKAQFEASLQMDSEAPMAAELEAAERENREPQVINVELSKETSRLKAATSGKGDFNSVARAESNQTRLGKMHAGMPIEEITQAIRQNSKVLDKRLRAEMRLGGERAEKARANLQYLNNVLLPKIEDRSYFMMTPKAFAQEFQKVIGTGVAR